MRRRKHHTTGLQHGPFVRNPKAPSPLFESVLDGAKAGTHPGSSKFIDGSGRGNNGVLTGYSNPNTEGWKYSSEGGRWPNRFDGIANYIHIGNTINAGTVHTIALWGKLSDLTPEFQMPISDSSVDRGYALAVANDGRLLYNPGGANAGSVSLANHDTAWHHLAVVRKNQAVEFFQNGASLGTTAIGSNAVPLWNFIGVRDDQGVLKQHWNGLIADPLVYPFPLDSELIDWLSDRNNRLYIPQTRKQFYFDSVPPVKTPTARKVRRARGTPTTGLQHGPFVRNPKAPSDLFNSALDLAKAGTHPSTAYAIDGSGRNNNGVLTGYTNPNTQGWEYASGINRHAIRLPEDGRYLDLEKTVSVRGLTAFTIATWINMANYAASTIQSIHAEYYTDLHIRMAVRFQDLTGQKLAIRGRVTDAGSFLTFVSTDIANLPPAGTWWHLVAMRNGTSFELWVNGVQMAQNTDTGTAFVDAEPNDVIMGLTRNGINSLRGSIADYGMWRFPLDPALITWLADPANRLYVPRTSKQFYAPLTIPPTTNRRRRLLCGGYP